MSNFVSKNLCKKVQTRLKIFYYRTNTYILIGSLIDLLKDKHVDDNSTEFKFDSCMISLNQSECGNS